jgi:hypothetical protein
MSSSPDQDAIARREQDKRLLRLVFTDLQVEGLLWVIDRANSPIGPEPPRLHRLMQAGLTEAQAQGILLTIEARIKPTLKARVMRGMPPVRALSPRKCWGGSVPFWPDSGMDRDVVERELRAACDGCGVAVDHWLEDGTVHTARHSLWWRMIEAAS